ncbi:hypothetical protein [Streptomyces sp. NPDC089795]
MNDATVGPPDHVAGEGWLRVSASVAVPTMMLMAGRRHQDEGERHRKQEQ